MNEALTKAGPGGAVSVVVPVYGNAESLPLLFEALLAVEQGLQERGLALDLVFVDDGSRDGSLAVLRALKGRRPATRVVKLSRNFGAVHASKTGFRYAIGDCVMSLAADLQDPPELILQMVDRWLGGSKIVICVRERREDPLTSRVFSWIYYRLIRLLVVKDYPRSGFDLALMGRELLPHLLDSPSHSNHPLFAYWLGFEPAVIHYTRRKRKHGTSAWSFRKRLNFFVDSLVGFSIVPLRAISALGLLVSLGSFGYGSIIAVNSLRYPREVPGFAALAVLLSFLLGLVIAMLGISGEYLWRIYEEVSRRPEAVVEEVW